MHFIPFERARSSDVITEIHFDTCNSSVICKLLYMNDQGSWWAIISSGVPTRFVCIKNFEGLKKFATNYGYMDKNDCVNFKTGKFKVETSFQHPVEYYKHQKTLKYITERHKHGVPQKSYNSGLCWYSAMCFAGFFNKQMREFIKYYSKDKILNNLIDICLDDPNAAEKLRQHLYYSYRIGDDPKQKPEDDGQNGMNEFLTLLAQLKIPFTRLFAPNLSEISGEVTDKDNNKFEVLTPTESQPSMLIVRCFRTRWRPEMTLKRNGIRYKLASVMIGSEYCGHQIGASTCDLRVCRWACADSDACREGIGPTFWKIKRDPNKESIPQFKERWWHTWGKVFPVVLFNSESMCDFSPHNRSSCTLESKTKKTSCTNHNAGVVNSDFIYIHI